MAIETGGKKVHVSPFKVPLTVPVEELCNRQCVQRW
jgi:hypothetical protein